MKIGIIETGRPSESLSEKYGNYPDMFAKLIGPHLPDTDFFTISVVAGQQLDSVDQADGWLITGSRHGAYEDHSWINGLEIFIQNCFIKSIPIVGVCFGHQIIAQAMGGKVEKSNKGWGVGPHKYNITNKPDWADFSDSAYVSHAVHQDQIIQLPTGASTFAQSDFCSYAALIYGNNAFPKAITVQSHPELSAEFVRDIGQERLARVVPAPTLESAMAKLGAPVNNTEWGKVFAEYFRRSYGCRATK